MSERGALVLAAGAHVLLLGALSFSLSQALPPLDAALDSTPIEFVEIGDLPTVTTLPKPSLEAAPRDPGPPAPAELAPDMLTEAPPLPPPPDPVATMADTAAQDAIAPEKIAPPPQAKRQLRETQRDSFDAGALASLIDKSIPDAPVKPKDTSAFAKSIEAAIPKGAKVSPRAIATLEQAIRSQIAPCWNPPSGGADVQAMTAVLRIRLNKDGSVAAAPEFVSQTGATAGNQAYARAFVETARRAVLRCAPLTLPADMFGYWQEFELNFDPRLMT